MDDRAKTPHMDPNLSLRQRGFEIDSSRARGLIYGFLFAPNRGLQELSWSELDTALKRENAWLWLHFDAANAFAREWLAHCQRLPEALREFLFDLDDRKHIEIVGESIIGVISDVHYRFDFDPDHIATLRFYLDAHCLISTRRQPLSATDQLRKAIREGLHYDNTATLMASLFRFQAEMLGTVATRLNHEVGAIEDQILAEQIHDQRRQLGKIRRLAVRLHRHFAPEHHALQRLCGRLPAWFSAADIRGLREATEEFGEVVNELDAIQERAKLLQEELAARNSEETNRNLFILSIVTTILLPMTLITGIFGMNVAGLPGLKDPFAFWWVMLGMVVVALIALLLLHWKRLF
jgi:zinc transporter